MIPTRKRQHKVTSVRLIVNDIRGKLCPLYGYFEVMFGIFKRNSKIKGAAYMLFTEIVDQARRPEFYADWHVADTLDGRFDLIILHVSLVINRLEVNGETKQMALLIRYLQEVLFENMDMSLRELGVGDMSVGKKVKVMAEAYYGRVAAYRQAIGSDDRAESLKPVLTRNIYRDQIPHMASLDHLVLYIDRQVKCLEKLSDEDLMSARLVFEKVN